MRAKYGENWRDRMREMGRKGGQNGRGEFYAGGFACLERGKDGLTGRERARKAGILGGTISRRGPAKKSMVRKVNDGESITKGGDE